MEAKTMIRIVLVAILLIALAGAACLGLVVFGSDTPFEGARAAAVNTILDQTGAKERIDAELRDNVSTIAQQTGVPKEVLETGIDMLDVKSWQAAELPDDAVQTANFQTEVDGQTVGITTYEDPSYVTVNAYGQTITFDVPKSTQTLTELAPLVNNVSDLSALASLL